MSFQNLYYQRTVATPRPCAVCYRPTTIVLSTIQNVDFIYTCERHLSDPGFATKVVDEPPPKKEVDPEVIKKVKEEWEEKQRKKKEKEDKEKDKNGKEKEKKETKVEPPPPTPPTPSAPAHARFTLHRSIFASRQAEHRKRRQMKEAREVAPRLPRVPGGAPDSY